MVSHPTQPLNHPLRMCLGALPAGPPHTGQAALSWPSPHCLPGSPTLLPSQRAAAQRTLLPAPSGAGVNLERLCVVKILEQLLTVVE